MTSPPIFPALPGQGWGVHKRPTFATTVASHVSAREVRSAHYANPVWQFELSFDGLDATAAAQYGGLGAQSLQSLMGLFLQCQGQYGAFLFYDATDYQVSGQSFGTGDGTTTGFQLARSLGGFNEAVVAPVTSAATLHFSSGASVAATAPGPGVAVSADFGVLWLCRFAEDVADLENFMALLWRWATVKLQTGRP